MRNLFKSIALFSVVIVIALYSAVSYSENKSKSAALVLTPVSKTTTDGNYDQFLQDIIKRVKKDYVEEKTDKQLAEAAASGILSSLDPHSSYLNEDDLKEIQVQTRGEFGGLGIEVTMEFSLIKVVAAIDGTPAGKAGIKSGD